MTMKIDVSQPLIPQVITALREAGFSCARIAELLGISRATLYNRYLSRDKYLERLARRKKTRIVVSKGGRPSGSKNKTKNKTKRKESFWTQEELRELMRIWGSGWKQVARAVKELKPQTKSLEAMRRLANEFRGKPVAYICKAIRAGAYFEELHRLEDEKWEKKQNEMKKEERITPEMIAETDKIINEKFGWMINPKTHVDPLLDYEKELEDFCRRYGIDVQKGKEIWRRL